MAARKNRRCQGCQKLMAIKSHLLCRPCRRQGIKPKPPARPKKLDYALFLHARGNRFAFEDFDGSMPEPDEPCSYLPGTEDRIRVYQERQARRQSFWHPRDPGRLTLEHFAGVLS